MTTRSILAMTSTAIAWVAFACLPLAWAQQVEQTSPPPAVEVAAVPRPVAMPLRVTDVPIIDGVLDERVWQGAMLLTGFIQADPLEGAAASEETEVRILYDDTSVSSTSCVSLTVGAVYHRPRS